MKVGVLAGIFGLIEDGHLEMDSKVHVRNRFFSLVDNTLFKTATRRDACATLYASLGKNMDVSELAYHMIITSSNLATNLLIDLVGVEHIQEKLKQLNIQGIELLRGVEDELAWEHGINNRITANALVRLFRVIEESEGFSKRLSDTMIRILEEQRFNSGIPKGIPPEIRKLSKFAHKTGEISTVAHDAGLVYLPGRKPYALAILTQRIPGESNSNQAIQRLSKLVYDNFIKTKMA
ncbi:hypothetical protein GCM10023331_30580 [Algivirga pacifica]|uniref:beta-lactamase n=2 Tax=Algivirga pacifica TaxID=1162670 RepID=A0ABP9DF54_9BACT